MDSTAEADQTIDVNLPAKRLKLTSGSIPSSFRELSSLGRKTRQSQKASDLGKCLTCQGEKPDRKNRRVPEKLVQCVTFEVEFSLLNAAKIRNDERILMELEGIDGIALEVRYYRTCFQSFTHKRSLDSRPSQKLQFENETGTLHIEAFVNLVEFLDDALRLPTAIITMNDVVNKYSTINF